jgi:hypothetical protein
MSKNRSVISVLAGVVVCFILATTSRASSPRAFVSTHGSDSNPCNSNQPCRSFNQAITVVQPGGEIIVQDSGGYSAGLTITFGVTIDAGAFNASMISLGSGDLLTVAAGPADTVVLRGVSFHGAGLGTNGINATSVGSLYLERCSFNEFTNDDVKFASSGNLVVGDGDIRKTGHDGIEVAPASGNAMAYIHHSYMTKCGNAGVDVGPNAVVSVAHSAANGCGIGFLSATTNASNADLTLDDCHAVGNTTGLEASASGGGAAVLRFAYCLVTQNTTGISTASGTGTVNGSSPGSSVVAGNGTNISGTLGSGMTLQ